VLSKGAGWIKPRFCSTPRRQLIKENKKINMVRILKKLLSIISPNKLSHNLPISQN
jgi:hypothetical protein